MTNKANSRWACLILGGALLFPGTLVWAGDDDDLSKDEESTSAEYQEIINLSSLSDMLKGEHLQDGDFSLFRLLDFWACAVQAVFVQFEKIHLVDNSWGLLLEGLEESFTGEFKEIFDFLRASHEARVEGSAYTHAQAVVACLFRYLAYLTYATPEPIHNGLQTARAYIARRDPPRFQTYAERVAHFNQYPNERIVHRHPFFMFMHAGYWNMRGWVNQYPALQGQRHGLFHLAHAGVNLGWINEYNDDAAGMAQAQFREYLNAILRTLKRIKSFGEVYGNFNEDVASTIIVHLASVFNRTVGMADEAKEDEASAKEIQLRVRAAIIAEFLIRLNEFLYTRAVDDEVDSIDEVLKLWRESLDAALKRVRAILVLEAEEDDEGEDEGTLSLEEYLECLALDDEDSDRGHTEDGGVEVEIIGGFEDWEDHSYSDEEDGETDVVQLEPVTRQDAVLLDTPLPVLVAPSPQRVGVFIGADAIGDAVNGCGATR